jgi:TRAP-type C4-dicarboxylate transport system substrate-binding protein
MSIERIIMIKYVLSLVICIFPILTVAAEFKFKLHTFEPNRSSMYNNVFEPFAEKVSKDSNGRIAIQLYPYMTIGGRPADLFSQVSDGVVDFAMIMINLTPGRFLKTETVELPLIFSNAPASSKAMHEFIMENTVEEFNTVIPLGFGVTGPSILNMKSDGNSVIGKKIRISSKVTGNLLRKQQGVPIGMAITEVGPSLQKGVLDGVITSMEGAGIATSYEFAKHIIYMPDNKSINTAAFALVMNKQSFNKLPKDLQEVILKNSGITLSEKIGTAQHLGDERIKERAVSTGAKFTVLSREEFKSWEKSAKEVEEEWIKDKESAGVNNPKMLIDKLKSKVKKYDKK